MLIASTSLWLQLASFPLETNQLTTYTYIQVATALLVRCSKSCGYLGRLCFHPQLVFNPCSKAACI